MQQLAKAIAITSDAFKGDLDKGGVPYIMHCLHVMNIVGKKTDNDPEMMCIAVMHDLKEDKSEWTDQRLIDEGFSHRVIRGVDSMTHRHGESYEDYIDRIAKNPDARVVKMVDLKHNSDIHRMTGLTPKHFARLEKYHKAYAFLRNLYK